MDIWLACFVSAHLPFLMVVEGSPSLFWGVRPAAGDGACTGATEGGGVPVVHSRRCKTRSLIWKRWLALDTVFQHSQHPVIILSIFKTYFSFTSSPEEHVSTRWHQRSTATGGADRGEVAGSGSLDWPERAETAGQRPGGALAGKRLIFHKCNIWK